MNKEENIKLNFLHVCDYASFGENGKINILGIFENIRAKNFPYVHPQLFVVVNISIYKNGEYQNIIQLVNEENVELGKIIFPIKVNSKNFPAGVGIMGQLNSIKFEKPGRYYIKVFLDDNEISKKELNVMQI